MNNIIEKYLNENNERTKYVIMIIFCMILITFGIASDSFDNIIKGIYNIIITPDTLITDYIQVGGPGAAFVNAGLLALSVVYLFSRIKVNLTGPAVASIFTVAGFALFGKNLYNVWPIIVGVWLYGRIKKEEFRQNILIAIFGTALSPIVSEITFAMGLNLRVGIILGISIGILVGMCLPPLARFFLGIHQGYNLFNVGFTAGFIGTVILSIIKTFGLSLKGEMAWSTGQRGDYFVPALILFLSMIILGFCMSQNPFVKLKAIFKKSGRLVTDYVIISGFGASLINMGLMGLLGILYLTLISGDFNGPTLGAVLTIVGFGAFGIHLRNAVPIMIGVFIMASLSIWPVNGPEATLAALFGITLAPIAGTFGWVAGLIAGALHLTIVTNVGYLHGGLNLYNNGFSGGIVAIVMLPILEALKEE